MVFSLHFQQVMQKKDDSKNSEINNTFLTYLTIPISYKFELSIHCYLMSILSKINLCNMLKLKQKTKAEYLQNK